jgi:hypothetical protein
MVIFSDAKRSSTPFIAVISFNWTVVNIRLRGPAETMNTFPQAHTATKATIGDQPERCAQFPIPKSDRLRRQNVGLFDRDRCSCRDAPAKEDSPRANRGNKNATSKRAMQLRDMKIICIRVSNGSRKM